MVWIRRSATSLRKSSSSSRGSSLSCCNCWTRLWIWYSSVWIFEVAPRIVARAAPSTRSRSPVTAAAQAYSTDCRASSALSPAKEASLGPGTGAVGWVSASAVAGTRSSARWLISASRARALVSASWTRSSLRASRFSALRLRSSLRASRLSALKLRSSLWASRASAAWARNSLRARRSSASCARWPARRRARARTPVAATAAALMAAGASSSICVIEVLGRMGDPAAAARVGRGRAGAD